MVTGSKASDAAAALHDWLGACRARGRRPAEGAARAPDEHPSASSRPASGARAATSRSSSTPPPRTPSSPSSTALHGDGARFTAVSEERGIVDYGDRRRARRHRSHRRLAERQARPRPPRALGRGRRRPDDGRRRVRLRLRPRPERGVARGPRRRRVPQRRAAGPPARPSAAAATASSSSWRSSRPTRAGSPRPATRSCNVTGRVRAMGSIAISLCQVAATRVDGMAPLWNCRAVDAAAGQLVVREAGGVVAFTACDDPLSAPLDLEPRSPVVAARTDERARRARHPSRLRPRGDDLLVIDWTLAERVAGAVAGSPNGETAKPLPRRPRHDGRRGARARRRLRAPRARERPPAARGRRPRRLDDGEPAHDARHARPARSKIGGRRRAARRAAARRRRDAPGGRDRRDRRLHGPPRARPVRARAARSRAGRPRCCSWPRTSHEAARGLEVERGAAPVGRLPRGHPRRAVQRRAVAARAPRRDAARALVLGPGQHRRRRRS